MMFTPGDKLEYGHYTVLRELGAGGMGVVYHCRDEFLQREIAIKMLLPELMADDDTVEVFRQEARLAAQLEHPNVVTIHNIGMENREGKVHHYIAMEFLPGGSLKGRIQKENESLEQCVEWMKQLAVGLNYAHKRGVVHQDIKPDNIFITHDGNLKIGDFGLALIATGVAVERAVQGKGTPAYMSPELCRGDPQDSRSDIYSLGAVFFELLTKERPFKASGMIEMAMKHATAPIPSARKVNPQVPEVLDRAIQKMMAKQPEDRYQSLAEVLTILEKLLLELQVARLGVGTSAQIPDLPAPPKSVPPPPLPSAAAYADDWNNYVAGQEQQNQTKAPVKPPEPKPAPPPPLPTAPNIDVDPLDDLLDSLLSPSLEEELGGHGPEPAAPPAAASKAEPAPAPGETPAESVGKRSRIMDDDITGDIDAVYQDIVRAEVSRAASAQSARSTDGGAKGDGASGDKVAGGADPAPKPSKSSGAGIGAPSEKKLDLIWKFKTSGPIGWSSMPVVSKDRKMVFVGSSDGTLYALEAQKGTRTWRFETGAAIVASPVIVGDKILIANSSGLLICLDSHGNKQWAHEAGNPIVATPVVHNDQIILCTMDGSVKLLSMESAKQKWIYRTEGPVVSSVQILENLVFFGSKDKAIHAVSLDKGLKKWAYLTQGSIVSTPLVSTDSVYAGSGDGHLYCLEAETGKLVWKYPTDKSIVSKGTLEFTSVTVCSEDKWLHCVEKYKGGLVWKARVHGQVMTNLVSLAGNLYVTTREGWLQCFNLRSGELNWQMNCEKRLESSPLVSNKVVYLGTVSGEVFAYNLPSN